MIIIHIAVIQEISASEAMVALIRCLYSFRRLTPRIVSSKAFSRKTCVNRVT